MDDQIAGPSGLKKRKTNSDSTKPLTAKQLNAIAENLSDLSDDPYEDSEKSWSGSDEDSTDENYEEEWRDPDEIEHFANTAVSDDDQQDIIWSDVPDLQHFAFTGNLGLRVPDPGDEPYDYFSLLVTDVFLENIVSQTNLYAETVFLSENTKEKSRITHWKPVTLLEMETFLGLWLHMGNIKINRLQDYWKIDDLHDFPVFRRCMCRNRFFLIMRCLHMAETPERGEAGFGDRPHKIRSFQEYFSNKMEEVYYPNKDLSLDESMVLWRGRLSFRQFIKGKKHKYGMKLYILAGAYGA